MPAAPVQDDLDGTVRGLLAHWQDPAAVSTLEYAVDYLRYRLIQAVRGTAAVGHVNVLAPPATPAHQVWYRELVRPGDEVLANAGGESAHW